MIAITKSAAVEYEPGIRVNVVSPTFAETSLTAPLLADPGVRADVDGRIPFGRVGLPRRMSVLDEMTSGFRLVSGRDRRPRRSRRTASRISTVISSRWAEVEVR